MLLIAHRGYSIGKDENTLRAFERAAADSRVDGIEIDIRFSEMRGCVILSHDPLRESQVEQYALSLADALSFAKTQDWEVLLECKEYSDKLYQEVCTLVALHELKERVTLFAFPAVARHFPWRAERPVRLGIIEAYPWRFTSTLRRYAPDMLLTGWFGAWTRAAVRVWWSFFSLTPYLQAYPATRFVVGVARDHRDARWCSSHGFHAMTVDLA